MKITLGNRIVLKELYKSRRHRDYKWTIDYIIFHIRGVNGFKIRKPHYDRERI